MLSSGDAQRIIHSYFPYLEDGEQKRKNGFVVILFQAFSDTFQNILFITLKWNWAQRFCFLSYTFCNLFPPQLFCGRECCFSSPGTGIGCSDDSVKVRVDPFLVFYPLFFCGKYWKNHFSCPFRFLQNFLKIILKRNRKCFRNFISSWKRNRLARTSASAGVRLRVEYRTSPLEFLKE